MDDQTHSLTIPIDQSLLSWPQLPRYYMEENNFMTIIVTQICIKINVSAQKLIVGHSNYT